MGERWCGRCRAPRPIEWQEDITFGPRAESARCPVCGAVWGVRDRRKVPAEPRLVPPQRWAPRAPGAPDPA